MKLSMQLLLFVSNLMLWNRLIEYPFIDLTTRNGI